MSGAQASGQKASPLASPPLAIKTAPLATATHLSSTQLTPTLVRHRFHLTPSLSWTPTQHIELQLPADLDPTGSAYTDPSTRRILLTPCNYVPFSHCCETAKSEASIANVRKCAGKTVLVYEVEFIAGAGRVASLIGLPRFVPLRAEVVDVAGGFLDRGGWESRLASGAVVAVAGGSGIAPFVALESGGRLLWSVGAVDTEMVTELVGELRGWGRVEVFITGAQNHRETDLRKFLTAIKLRHEGIQVAFRRMKIDDLKLDGVEDVLFCGGKALEWQVKMWAMKMSTTVVTTAR